MSGKVYLVGAGPGDPGLLTLRGRQCLSKADVVVYDYLANPRLLDHAPVTAERILVGKHGGGARVEQDVINALIIDRARRGQTVVRLKGGDPFIFGRGGEEAAAVRQAGLEFEIVPGVSAAIAVPAYAGIPLTHRELASNVIFTTGYEYSSKTEPAVRWNELARSGSTLVLLMTARQLAANMVKLIEGGLAPSTPAAVIEWGTRADQRTLVGTVATIAEQAAAAGVKPPTIAIVGDVVGLRPDLMWFERKPLFGRRIVVTRPRDQSGTFADALEDFGAEVVCLPTIAIVPASDCAALDRALLNPQQFAWVVFTSANGVRIFFERLGRIGADIRSWHGVRIAAIGPQTARQLRDLYVQVDLIPEEYRAEGVVEMMSRHDLKGKRVLLPRAEGSRDVLPEQLTRLGALVDEIHTYRSVPSAEGLDEVVALAKAGALDLVTFTSSSTVQSFVAGADGRLDLAGLTVGCIGPITAETARGFGMSVSLQPQEYTIPAFVDAIVAYFAGKSSA